MVFFVVHGFVSFDTAIYYGFSLLHTYDTNKKDEKPNKNQDLNAEASVG